MTVIQKKRKFDHSTQEDAEYEDYGEKYHCDSCQKDITRLVRIRCYVCKDFDLCVECFGEGVELRDHKNNHSYRVMDILDFPIFDSEWGADEELLLIEGLEMFGIGNWEQIAEHIGTKSKYDCAQHYFQVFISSQDWPLPDMSKSFNEITERRSAKKERRAIKQLKYNRPPSSAPTNHEVSGFMPGRLEFDVEFDNDSEQYVKDMVFNDDDTIEDTKIKRTVLDIYNYSLRRRIERKKFYFDRGLLDYKKQSALDKKRQKEEKECYTKSKYFARMQTKEDFELFVQGLNEETRLRQRIHLLQEYRRMGITTMKDAAEYEREKQTRTTQQKGKEIKTSQKTVVSKQEEPREDDSKTKQKPVAPLDIRNTEGFDLLSPQEQNLCSSLRLLPRAYLVIKDIILTENQRRGGKLRKRECRGLVKIDVNKTGKVWDFFLVMGWVGTGAASIGT